MAGSWDLTFCGIRNAIEFEVPLLMDVLSNISHRCGHHALNITFVTTVPYPLKRDSNVNTHRNYESMRALSLYIQTMLAAYHPYVRIVDTHRILGVFPDDTVCNDHYVCKVKSGLIYLNAGYAAYNVLTLDLLSRLYLSMSPQATAPVEL